jgi:hypothetical protein
MTEGNGFPLGTPSDIFLSVFHLSVPPRDGRLDPRSQKRRVRLPGLVLIPQHGDTLATDGAACRAATGTRLLAPPGGAAPGPIG